LTLIDARVLTHPVTETKRAGEEAGSAKTRKFTGEAHRCQQRCAPGTDFQCKRRLLL